METRPLVTSSSEQLSAPEAPCPHGMRAATAPSRRRACVRACSFSNHGEAWRALLAVIRVEKGGHARPPSETVASERPGVRRAEVRVGPTPLRAVVERVREVVLRGRAADGEERAHRAAARRARHVKGPLREAAEGDPGVDLRARRQPGLEEDGAPDAEAIGVERCVAAIHLDAIDHVKGHGGEVRGPGEVVVQANAGEIHRSLGAGRAAYRGRGEDPARAGSRHLDAGYARQHLRRRRARTAKLFSGNRGGQRSLVAAPVRRRRRVHRHRRVVAARGLGARRGRREQRAEERPRAVARARSRRHGHAGCTIDTASRS